MALRNLQNPLVILIILFKSIPSSSLIYLNSKQLGPRLCWEIPDDFSTCPVVESQVFDHLLQPNSYPNITSPRIALNTFGRLVFNVRFKNDKIIHNVSQFVMTAEDTEVEIDLQSSHDYLATCFSFGSTSTFSSNTKNSPKFHIDYSNQAYPDLYTHAQVRISRKSIHSGYLSCRSVENVKNVETFRIFTYPSAEKGASPFASVHDLSIQSDEAGGFIVPCRTTYRLESPPSLQWKKHEKDDFTSLTTEEMKSFRWDSRMGFQFNSSNRMWEMEVLACKVDSYNKTFLPTPSRFKTSIIVKAETSQIGCELKPRTRSDSSKALLDANFKFQKAGYHHSCGDFINCKVAMESGMHLQSTYYDSTFGLKIQDLNTNFGVFSCWLEHSYESRLVPEVSSRMFFKGLDSNVYLLPGPYPHSSVIQISQVDGPTYQNHTKPYQEFSCITLDFFVASRIYFKLRYRNQTETVHTKLNKVFKKHLSSKAQFKVSLNTNVTHAICFCLTQEGKVMSSEERFQLGDGLAPVMENTATSTVSESLLDVDSMATATGTSEANHDVAATNRGHVITLGIIGYTVVTVAGLTF